MPVPEKKHKVFHNILTDIQTAKLTKIDTLRKFQTLFGKKDPMLSLIFTIIEKRTIEYGKFFETISFKDFMEDTGISERKIQYLITELLEKGLIVRATSQVTKYKYTYAYSFNWLALTEDIKVKAEFLKEYNRVGKFTSLSKIDDKMGAPGAGSSENGRTRCGSYNNNNHKINNNNHSDLLRPSDEGRGLQIIGGTDMDKTGTKTLLEQMKVAEEKFLSAKAKKVTKAKTATAVTLSGVKACWERSIIEHFPDSRLRAYSDLDVNKLAAKLRSNFCSKGIFDVKGAYEFLEWSVQNWGMIVTSASMWWRQVNVGGDETNQLSPVPDMQNMLWLFKSAYRIKYTTGQAAAMEEMLGRMDADPVERERAKLKAMGLDDASIEKAIERRRKHLEREDRYSAIRKQSKQWTEAMQTAASSMYSTYARSAKNALAIAATTSATIAPESMKLPMLGDTVTGPDGVEYPIEVMVHFIPAPWDDDPEIMQQSQDKAFFKAVEDFNSNKLFGGTDGSDE